MKKNKKTSINRVITFYTTMTILLISVIMVAVVNLMNVRLIRYDIRSTLASAIRRQTRDLDSILDLQTYEMEGDFEENGIYFQIVDSRGTLRYGEDSYAFDLSMDDKERFREVTLTDGTYYTYVIQLRVNDENDTPLYCLAYINKENTNSRYVFFRYLSYTLVPIMMVLALISSYLISRRITKPLEVMVKSVSGIGEESDLSKRMEYDGRIAEFAVLAKQNNEMLDRVENMLQIQKQFSSDVAHELRTPISVMMAECEWVKNQGADPETCKEAFEVFDRQTTMTNDIVTKLLHLNRLNNGTVTPEFEDMELDDIVLSICEDIEDQNDQVTFHNHLTGVHASVDLGLIHMALKNLIENAVKYSLEPVIVEVNTFYDYGKAVVTVRDYGCGIPPEDIEHIFTPFYRAEKSRSSKGYGLGLPLTGRIAQVHGGCVRVQSEPGMGSVFQLEIPTDREEAKVPKRRKKKKRPQMVTLKNEKKKIPKKAVPKIEKDVSSDPVVFREDQQASELLVIGKKEEETE